MRRSLYKDQDKFLKARRRQKKRYYGKTKNAKNRNQSWTLHDINLVMEHSISDMELSQKIGRSVASIQQIRCRYKKIYAEKTKKES